MSNEAVHSTPEASFIGTAALAQYVPVKLDTAANKVVVATAATDRVIGFTQNLTTAAGEPVTVKVSGFTLAKVGSTWAKGDRLTPSTAGVLIPTTTSGDLVCAVAQEIAATGEYGEVRMIEPKIYSAC